MNRREVRVMSKKWMALFAGLVGSLAFVAGTMQGCGSSGGSGNNQALCNQVCDKIAACLADAGVPTDPTSCKQTCAMQSQQHCANETAFASKAQECLDTATCAAAEACAATLETLTCEPTTGTGGSTGAGGTTGTGGTSGGGCMTCVKADACCMALGGTATDCMSEATCTAQPAANQGTFNSGCAQALAAIAAQPNAPAACK
jgi:hypothetical protein